MTEESAQDAIQAIEQWIEAYPVSAFPEPNWKEVDNVLRQNGLSIDQISASNFRHVLEGIRKIIERHKKV